MDTVQIAVTGASGLIGSALVAELRSNGDRVVRLVRRAPRAADEVRWDPTGGTVDMAGLDGTDAIVHLAGAGIGDHRWTADYKRTIKDSRVQGTRTISEAAAKLDPLPRVLVSASGIDYYGDTAGRVVDEDSPSGHNFLADVARSWEQAADPAREGGIRVVHPRSAIVAAPVEGTLSRLPPLARLVLGGSLGENTGGSFGQLLPLFRLGLGGPLGSGRQWWSLISLVDEVRAYRYVIEHDQLDGPVNFVAVACRNADVARALGHAMRRPAVFPVPTPLLRAVLGELSEVCLTNVRADPAKLKAAGFTFRHPDLASIVDYAAGSGLAA
jgi:uncharacterized protein